MPPLDGPRDVLWWTRYPVNTLTLRSSRWMGMATVRMRLGLRRISWTPGSSSSMSAACCSCDRAASQGDVVVTSAPWTGRKATPSLARELSEAVPILAACEPVPGGPHVLEHASKEELLMDAVGNCKLGMGHASQQPSRML